MCYFYNVETVWASQMAPVVKNSPDNAGVIRGSGLIPGSGRSPGEGKGYPLQYSGLEKSMDCRVHGIAKSQTRLSDWTELNWTEPEIWCPLLYLESRSVVSDSLQLRGLRSPWNSPGQNTGVGSHSLLRGIFPTQGSNLGLLHCGRIVY